jgi:hypothetical protein
MRPEAREHHLYRAIAEDSGRRESWVDLAMHYYEKGEWKKCLRAATSAVDIKEKPLDYLCEAEAWGALPYDLKAIAAYNLGLKTTALIAGEKAAMLNPTDERLQKNLDWYRIDA